MNRIHLLAPYIHDRMNENVLDAINSGWITTKGPQLDQFEQEMKQKFGFRHIAFTNSGTAALHVAMVALNIGKGDKVIVSDLSFCAVANTVLYAGAEPILIDSELETWGIDPQLLEDYLKRVDTTSIKALILVHLYGNPSQILKIRNICDRYNIRLIEDSAEALGSKVGDQYCGTIGDVGIISFNGNKILTTGGGGMVVSHDEALIKRVKYLANQAKSLTKNHYWHEEVGFNYGLSNISASVGLGQLLVFDEILDAKQRISQYYLEFCNEYDSLEMITVKEGILANCWLNTVILKKHKNTPIDWNDLLGYFRNNNIEIRRFWTPLHLQPAYHSFEFISNGVGEKLFDRGVCMPSSPNLTMSDQHQIIEMLEKYLTSRGFFETTSVGV